jgi:hypothetical protein
VFESELKSTTNQFVAIASIQVLSDFSQFHFDANPCQRRCSCSFLQIALSDFNLKFKLPEKWLFQFDSLFENHWHVDDDLLCLCSDNQLRTDRQIVAA